jgi:hypothetical protein
MAYSNTVSLTNSYSFDLFPWWEVQTNATVQYQEARSSRVFYNAPLAILGINLYIHQQVRLPKNFSIEVSGMYQSKSITGMSHSLSFGSLNAGIQKSFGDRGTVRLSMDDILGTNNWRIVTHLLDNNLGTSFNYNWHNRFIRLVYTTSFGDIKLKSVKVESGSEEERRRVN